MLLALLFLTVPAALAFLLLTRAGLFDSALARAFTAWFVGECVAVFAVYGLAVSLAPWTGGVLRKAALAVLAASAAALAVCAVRLRRSGALRRGGLSPFPGLLRVLFLAACALFAFLFYRPHLKQTPDAIFRSPVYWDFNVHAPIVQTFAFGDNFPAGNESFAGAPLTYHFFFDLFTAVPVSFGVGLADAFLLTAAASLFGLLALLAGFSEELLGGPGAGMLAALFACTSSSLRFIDSFRPRPGWSLAGPFLEALHRHPYLVSFVPGNPFAYNGTMLNAFYFVEERQLVFASGFLLAAVLLSTTRGKWSLPASAAAGLLFGLFVFWHLFVTISLGLALVWLLAFAPEKRKTAVMLAGMAAAGAGFALWVHGAMRMGWFLAGERGAMRWNTAFSTYPGGPAFSVPRAVGYWIYAWGLKAAIGAAGVVAAFRNRRVLFHALASVLVPTFFLVNTIRIAPLSVYDNHKWLRPMCLFLDLAAGFFLVDRVLRARLPAALRVALVSLATVLMTVSGAIELLPFLASRTSVLYAAYPTRMTRDIREHTAPRSVFASFESNAVHLAGRRLFVGNDADERGAASLAASAGLDTGSRDRIVYELYAAPSRDAFCGIAAAAGIDWLEVEPEVRRPSGADARAPGFDTITSDGRPVRFLDVSGLCRPAPLTPRAAPP